MIQNISYTELGIKFDNFYEPSQKNYIDVNAF